MTNRKITENTKVRVINNINGSIGFDKADGKREYLRNQGNFKIISVEDLIYLYSLAPRMLEEGTLLISDKDVVEYLKEHEGFDDSRVIPYTDIDKLLEEASEEEFEETLKNTSKEIQREVAEKAKEKKIDSKGKTKIIKEVTNIDIDEVK